MAANVIPAKHTSTANRKRSFGGRRSAITQSTFHRPLGAEVGRLEGRVAVGVFIIFWIGLVAREAIKTASAEAVR